MNDRGALFSIAELDDVIVSWLRWDSIFCFGSLCGELRIALELTLLVAFCYQVRGLGVSHDGVIATGSRDKSVRVWNSIEGERDYNLDKTLVGHTNFVGTVAWIPPNEALPAGGLVSGGMDTRVLVWDLENVSIAKDLKGHKLQVSNVAVDSNGDILSASVDRYFSLMLFLS